MKGMKMWMDNGMLWITDIESGTNVPVIGICPSCAGIMSFGAEYIGRECIDCGYEDMEEPFALMNELDWCDECGLSLIPAVIMQWGPGEWGGACDECKKRARALHIENQNCNLNRVGA